MKENTANQDRDHYNDNEQQNSNMPNTERENDTPASGLKNNDAWTTGIEAHTPMQETNPPSYISSDSVEIEKESTSKAINDPDEWKTGGEHRDPDQWKKGDEHSTEMHKTGLDTDQKNTDNEKENSF